MVRTTRLQREALKRVHQRVVQAHYPVPGRDHAPSYLQFRRTVLPGPSHGCVMVPFANMWLGIETDGHTHS